MHINQLNEMKLVHTSDWHLGQHFYRFDRDDEHEHFVEQLAEIVKAEQPDALIVSGDVYDNAAPSVLAQQRFVQSMIVLHDACPNCSIVVTAGNHDSGNRLDVHRPIWEKMRVKVIGTCKRAEDGTFDSNEFIVPISDKGYVVAVPYFHSHNFPMAAADTEREVRQQRFFEKVMESVTGMNERNQPIVVMAHLAVEGCDIKGHEDSAVGGMEKESLTKLGSGYDYLALGHIHMSQSITERVRYSGSPIPLSFSEAYQHTVSVVEMDAHGDVPKVKELRISPLRNIMTISAENLDDALRELEKVEDDVYIRILIDQEGILPADAELRAQLVVEGKPCRLCEVRKVMRKREASEDTDIQEIDITAPDCTIRPIDIARRHFRKLNNAEMPEELVQMLEEVITEFNNVND